MSAPALKVALTTACGGKKRDGEWPACELYLSSRIKAFCNRRREIGTAFYILSAEYGLIHSEQRIRSYQRVMDLERARKLAPQIAEVMKQYDWLVYFKGGSRDEYAQCVRWASDVCNVPVALIGFKIMGEFQECLHLAERLYNGEVPQPGQFRSLEIHGPLHPANMTK